MMSTTRVLHKEVVVPATPEHLWPMWTTAEGLSWISARSRIDPVPGGDYAWFLDLEPDEQGLRGSEGSKLISLDPQHQLVFDWTFPPDLPALRSSAARTQVTVRFDPVDGSSTRVILTQVGWDEGADWDAGYAYFDRAWAFVLSRLEDAAIVSATKPSP